MHMNLIIPAITSETTEVFFALCYLGVGLFAILLLVSPLIIIGRLGKILKRLERQIQLLEWIADHGPKTPIARTPS